LFKYKKEYENEKEIKDNCKIIINNDIIPFGYFIKFNKIGKYNIKYIFKKNITKINYMFFGCKNLTNIDLSNFNTNNVTNMRQMFFECSSLEEINLSNFIINNATNITSMFYGCSNKLKKKILTQIKNIRKEAFKFFF
jgi:surface protein